MSGRPAWWHFDKRPAYDVWERHVREVEAYVSQPPSTDPFAPDPFLFDYPHAGYPLREFPDLLARYRAAESTKLRRAA